MNTVYLSLGSNEGNRTRWLHSAIDMLNSTCGVITSCSSIYETAAWGLTDQPSFLNMAVELQTTSSAPDLLNAILTIETRLGRQRSIKWGPRTLDIDILLYNHEIINTADLKVPHPFLHERRFTLLPLAEIAPHYMHPLFNKSIRELLTACADTLEVYKFIEK